MGVEEEEGGKGQDLGEGEGDRKKVATPPTRVPSLVSSVSPSSLPRPRGEEGLLRIVRGSGSRGRGKRRRERDFFPLFPIFPLFVSALSTMPCFLFLSLPFPCPASPSTDKRGNHLAFCRFLLNPFFSPPLSPLSPF